MLKYACRLTKIKNYGGKMQSFYFNKLYKKLLDTKHFDYYNALHIAFTYCPNDYTKAQIIDLTKDVLDFCLQTGVIVQEGDGFSSRLFDKEQEGNL